MQNSDPTPQPRKVLTRYALNDGFTKLLDEAERVNDAARDPRFDAALARRGMNQSYTDAQKADIASARVMLQTTHAGRGAGRAATTTKSAARERVELLIGQFQSAALQSDLLSETHLADNYFVGADIGNANESQLEAMADGIVEQLSHDELPGVSPQDETDYEAAVAAWEAEIENQRNSIKNPQNAQITLEELISKIKRHKQATQLAADAQYPFNQTGPDGARTNHVTRQLFVIPVSRKYRPGKA